jgi:hypothetical protein
MLVRNHPFKVIWVELYVAVCHNSYLFHTNLYSMQLLLMKLLTRYQVNYYKFILFNVFLLYNSFLLNIAPKTLQDILNNLFAKQF